METVTELRAKLADAIESNSPTRIKRIRLQLLIAGLSSEEIDELVRQVSEDILAQMAQNENYIPNAAVAGIIGTVISLFSADLLSSYRGFRGSAIRDIFRQLSNGQVSNAIGLPVDSTGNIKPRPATPGGALDESASIGTILRTISGLLVLKGDTTQNELTPPALLLEQQAQARFPENVSVNASDPGVSRQWIDKLRQLGSFMQTEVSLDRTIDDITQRWRQGVQVPLQRFASRVRSELRHEYLRLRGQAEDEAIQMIDGAIGYMLHSRFLETTAPDHAARDGQRFYKDNRAGSAAPWQNRIIPPYRKNCVCFTVPIIESGDEVFDAQFGIRRSGYEDITIRDVGTFDTWFSSQSGNIQRELVGDQAWFAAASSGLGQVRYSDFFRPDGTELSVQELLNESVAQRQARREATQRVFDLQSSRFFQTWNSQGGQFGGNEALELEYRRKLDRYLRNIQS